MHEEYTDILSPFEVISSSFDDLIDLHLCFFYASNI